MSKSLMSWDEIRKVLTDPYNASCSCGHVAFIHDSMYGAGGCSVCDCRWSNVIAAMDALKVALNAAIQRHGGVDGELSGGKTD